jgi:hypothetical protein
MQKIRCTSVSVQVVPPEVTQTKGWKKSQNWQWIQNKCYFGNFWWVRPLIWNTSVNYKEWCKRAVDLYKFWVLFAHWLADQHWAHVISDNEIAAMKALIPVCPWNSGTIADQPTQDSKNSVPVVLAVVNHCIHCVNSKDLLWKELQMNNVNTHFLIDSAEKRCTIHILTQNFAQ